MSEYEYSVTISRKPEQVFSYLSDARQAPGYLPAIRSIELQENSRIRAEIEIFGRRILQYAYFRIDDDSRKIVFGSEGVELFSGWLQVKQGPDLGAADLTVHLDLDLPSEQEAQIRRHLTDFDEIIQNELEGALQAIKNSSEGHGDPVEEANEAAPA